MLELEEGMNKRRLVYGLILGGYCRLTNKQKHLE